VERNPCKGGSGNEKAHRVGWAFARDLVAWDGIELSGRRALHAALENVHLDFLRFLLQCRVATQATHLRRLKNQARMDFTTVGGNEILETPGAPRLPSFPLVTEHCRPRKPPATLELRSLGISRKVVQTRPFSPAPIEAGPPFSKPKPARTAFVAVPKVVSVIDFAAYFLGKLRRSDLMERSGMGPAAVTRDIALYRELAPSNWTSTALARSTSPVPNLSHSLS
jgi:hypothetical protein